jgi:hypothetical protein
VPLGLDLLFHLLLSFHHQLSHLLHVEVRHLGLLALRADLLHLVGEEDGEFGTVDVLIAFLRALVVILIDFLDELSLDWISVSVRLMKLTVVFSFCPWLMALRFCRMVIMDCPSFSPFSPFSPLSLSSPSYPRIMVVLLPGSMR